jgi:hypothetical protein
MQLLELGTKGGGEQLAGLVQQMLEVVLLQLRGWELLLVLAVVQLLLQGLGVWVLGVCVGWRAGGGGRFSQ